MQNCNESQIRNKFKLWSRPKISAAQFKLTSNLGLIVILNQLRHKNLSVIFMFYQKQHQLFLEKVGYINILTSIFYIQFDNFILSLPKIQLQSATKGELNIEYTWKYLRIKYDQVDTLFWSLLKISVAPLDIIWLLTEIFNGSKLLITVFKPPNYQCFRFN